MKVKVKVKVKVKLNSIPSIFELESAYLHLNHNSPKFPECQDLPRYAQWSRFDPRLGEIWVKFIIKNWKMVSPLELRSFLLKESWPNTGTVLLEFAKIGISKSGEVLLFKHWVNLITEFMACASGELFFIGLRQFGGEAMQGDALFSLKEYERWGYLSQEQLLGSKKRTPPLLKKTRRNILEKLLSSNPRIRTQDYWKAIHRCVSIRQAERDLQKSAPS